ncbi:MAG: GNAT family N-acetyltransferase [Myxococcales bacterium]|nr:GNAT family N-acetyltransferase [Myxococcales bacterium]
MSPPDLRTLTDGDVQLSRIHPQDCVDLLEAVRASLTQLCTWQGWAHPDYSLDDAADYVASAWQTWSAGRGYDFAIRREGDPRILGMCSLNEMSPVRRSANLGYWVRTEVTGQGLATTAARLLARFGFERVGLRRISLFHAVGNGASGRVAEKVGFVREGRQRRVLRLHDSDHDAWSYALTSVDEIT